MMSGRALGPLMLCQGCRLWPYCRLVVKAHRWASPIDDAPTEEVDT